MSAVCDVCGKGPSFGKKLSRTGRKALKRRVRSRTPRRFNPNIQRVRAKVDGTPTHLNVCTSCLRAGKVQR
ncbi:50S ribosomal protein L28 [Actinopolymorpha pittospori]|uniref:Large ribosomal subunit protein bL28 n=1 Tax=Actinopolymorpha pittospori TaxID=648752 RepID=A0A927MY96_9ACTN|nr:large subunit ribosomal protein L28 [Actinopolymorpha pittospori]